MKWQLFSYRWVGKMKSKKGGDETYRIKGEMREEKEEFFDGDMKELS